MTKKHRARARKGILLMSESNSNSQPDTPEDNASERYQFSAAGMAQDEIDVRCKWIAEENQLDKIEQDVLDIKTSTLRRIGSITSKVVNYLAKSAMEPRPYAPGWSFVYGRRPINPYYRGKDPSQD